MKTFIRILQFFIGAFFIFSGFVKAIDPLGTSYKMHDYFTAFQDSWPALHGLWGFMSDTSTTWAVIMLVFELALGLALIVGWRPKLTLWLMFLLLVFFTFLTGYTYLSGYTMGHWYNPWSWVFHDKDMKVTDCGCFGDFMKLKPYTSFGKDVVLDILVLILMFNMGNMYTLLRDKWGTIIVSLGTFASLMFCFSNYLWGLPIIDFRPYKVGTNIQESMKLPPNAKTDSVQMVFIYKHNGKEVELTPDQIGSLDSTYQYVDRHDKVIREGDKPAIHDFRLTDMQGSDYTDDILNNPDYYFFLVAYEIDKTDQKVQGKINDFVALCDRDKIKFIGLTGSSPKEVDAFRHEHNSMFPYYNADATALKTMIRSNPGLMLLKHGTVIAMWHYKDFPSYYDVKKTYFGK